MLKIFIESLQNGEIPLSLLNIIKFIKLFNFINWAN